MKENVYPSTRFNNIFQYNFLRFLFTEGFLVFAGIVILLVIIVSSILSYTIYSSYQKSIQKNIEVSSAHINNILDEVFTESNRLMVYIGKQISHSGGSDLQYISELLKDTSGREYKSKNLFSWTFFDWVSPSCYQVVNSAKGILKDKPNMSMRAYCSKSRANPWTIQFSEPAIGIPSGMWVIPAGTGVTTEKGEFLGTIVVGFNIAELTSTLMEKLSGEKISFTIVDEKFNLILQSADNTRNETQEVKINELIQQSAENFKEIEGVLREPIEYSGIQYSFYRKMKNHPFIILTGIQHNLYTKQFRVLVLPPIIELLGLGLFFIVLLYISRNRIIKYSKMADKAKEEFIALINQKVQQHMDIVLRYSETLIRYLRGEITIGINKERQIEFISNIQKSALCIKTMTIDNLELSVVDINSAVKDSIYIHRELAFQKNIFIKTELDPRLPYIHADDFCIRQILLSLLASSLEYTPTGGKIWVSTHSVYNEDHSKISLRVRDNGFGLSELDQKRIKKRFDAYSKHKANVPFELDLISIQKLIKLHHGIFEVENIQGKGRVVTIEFLNNSLVSN